MHVTCMVMRCRLPSHPMCPFGAARVPGMLSLPNARLPGDPGCVPQASRLPPLAQAAGGVPGAAHGADGRVTGSDAGGRSAPSARHGMGLRDTSQSRYS